MSELTPLLEPAFWRDWYGGQSWIELLCQINATAGPEPRSLLKSPKTLAGMLACAFDSAAQCLEGMRATPTLKRQLVDCRALRGDTSRQAIRVLQGLGLAVDSTVRRALKELVAAHLQVVVDSGPEVADPVSFARAVIEQLCGAQQLRAYRLLGARQRAY